jgi:probable HAF family extracellular repeat protein
MTDLGLGTLPQATMSSARGINNKGQVVGYAEAGGYDICHAFLYSDGMMTDIGTLGGESGYNTWNSWAYAINERGQVVGRSDLGAESLP